MSIELRSRLERNAQRAASLVDLHRPASAAARVVAVVAAVRCIRLSFSSCVFVCWTETQNKIGRSPKLRNQTKTPRIACVRGRGFGSAARWPPYDTLAPYHNLAEPSGGHQPCGLRTAKRKRPHLINLDLSMQPVVGVYRDVRYRARGFLSGKIKITGFFSGKIKTRGCSEPKLNYGVSLRQIKLWVFCYVNCRA